MTYDVYIAHHGIKGQKWGVRRYQNEDGSYTDAGKRRYAKEIRKDAKDFLRKDVGLSRRDARKGAKVVAEARTNKDKDMSSELTDLMQKVTKREYDTANKYIIKQADGRRVLDDSSAKSVLKNSKKMAQIYESLGKKTISSLQLGDKYDFVAGLDSSVKGLFLNSTVYDKKTYSENKKRVQEEEELEKKRRQRAGLG